MRETQQVGVFQQPSRKRVRRHGMTIIVKSKIEKGSIRLPKKVGLPDGTRVVVRIEPVTKIKEKLKIISELSGAWSDDPTITPIFRAIDQERHRYFGREVSFE
jgi:predicted DNA-binding antitoxin AbrB/MazE fold protein